MAVKNLVHKYKLVSLFCAKTIADLWLDKSKVENTPCTSAFNCIQFVSSYFAFYTIISKNLLEC